jgi:hypothetical protein
MNINKSACSDVDDLESVDGKESHNNSEHAGISTDCLIITEEKELPHVDDEDLKGLGIFESSPEMEDTESHINSDHAGISSDRLII